MIEYSRNRGVLVSTIEYQKAGRLSRKIEYEYNPEGNLKRETALDRDGRTRETVEYEYAVHSN